LFLATQLVNPYPPYRLRAVAAVAYGLRQFLHVLFQASSVFFHVREPEFGRDARSPFFWFRRFASAASASSAVQCPGGRRQTHCGIDALLVDRYAWNGKSESLTSRLLQVILMATLVRIHRKGQMTLPSRLRTQAGISEGDLVEVAFARGKIVLTPKLVIDRSQFPNAHHEYTPEQRRIVDARLAKSDEDIKNGRVYGPFDTAAEMAASVEANIKKMRGAKRKRKPAR
jgi:AbrB family looped-hinge helix DNA binding protein